MAIAPAPVSAAAPRARLNWPFIVVATILHLGAAFALLRSWSWAGLLLVAVGQIVFGWIGIGMGYHRLLTHESYLVRPWLERVLATLGAMSLQGGPGIWVATHKQHHRFADRPGDPHSPREGFWRSHMGWMFRGGQAPYRHLNAVKRLSMNRYYRFLEVGQITLQFPLAYLLYLMGGWTFVLYGIFVRLVFTWHVTFAINSVCHVWGSRRYDTPDTSRNNLLMMILAGGEGLHNNHHHDAKSAKHRRGRWDFDPSWWMIKGLEKVGLATDVVEPRT